MSIIKAPALRPGDTIAVIAPAGPPDPIRLDRGVRLFRDAGYRIRPGHTLSLRTGYLAGSDAERAGELNRCFRDPEIRCILCARGGYGSMRILDQIDYDAIQKYPKILVGYSDITALLMAIHRQTGLVTFHGPMPGAPDVSDWSFQQLIRQISGQYTPGTSWMQAPDSTEPAAWGVHEGPRPAARMLGGCLSILATLSGTPWEPADDPFILFLEDTGEAPYRIDRLLTHLTHTHWFRHCCGLALGDFIQCDQRADDPEPTPAVWDVIRERLEELSIPVLSGLPLGHGLHNTTIPLGIRARIDGNTLIQLERGVIC